MSTKTLLLFGAFKYSYCVFRFLLWRLRRFGRILDGVGTGLDQPKSVCCPPLSTPLPSTPSRRPSWESTRSSSRTARTSSSSPTSRASSRPPTGSKIEAVPAFLNSDKTKTKRKHFSDKKNIHPPVSSTTPSSCPAPFLYFSTNLRRS